MDSLCSHYKWGRWVTGEHSHHQIDRDVDNELTGEASLGRLNQGKEGRQIHHMRNLGFHCCKEHPLFHFGVCPELLGMLPKDVEFVQGHLMSYPLLQK